jgi:hypothetical protein
VSSAANLNVPLLSPIRCGLSSWFFHVMVVPATTVKVAGSEGEVVDLDGIRGRTPLGFDKLLRRPGCRSWRLFVPRRFSRSRPWFSGGALCGPDLRM